MSDINSTVFVVDDDPLICQGITWLLESVHLKVETFADAPTFLKHFDPNRFGCLLIDVRMPGMSGLELQQQLNTLNNPIPIIMITGHGDVPMAVRAMQAGAKDFILKPFNDQVLLEKIQALLAEDRKRIQAEPLQLINKRYATLTARERQVMNLIVAGKLNKQIAVELKISMSTVELHRAHVMQKMQVRTLADLIKSALLIN